MNDSATALNRSGLNWGTDDDEFQASPTQKPDISDTPDLGKRGDFRNSYIYEVVDASKRPLVFPNKEQDPISQTS